MSACPSCGTTMSFVDGRAEWWCNRCLAARPASEQDRPAAPTSEEPARAGHLAADVAEHTVSLLLVLPIAAVGAIACAILFALGFRELAVGAALATLVLVWLAW